MSKRFSLARISAILCLGTALGCASSSLPDAQRIQSALNSSERPAADRARDAGRKPAQVIAFLGIGPGETVVDLLAAGGYYTEVLAIVVGPSGTVYAQNNAVVLEMRDGANEKALSARLAGDRLPNVERLDRELDDLGLAPDSIDAAFTALNFHDIYQRAGKEAAVGLLASVRNFLKPGGVLGIVDHAGNAGMDNSNLHRIEESLVLEASIEAGFEVEAVGDMLRSSADPRSEFVFADGLRGHTDRFVLRLRKPRSNGK
jgi:predicted methyltransferase